MTEVPVAPVAPPSVLVTLLVVAQEVPCPKEVHRVCDAVTRMLTCKTAAQMRAALNKAMGQALRHDPRLYHKLWAWTRKAQTAREFQRLGAWWALVQLHRAFEALMRFRIMPAAVFLVGRPLLNGRPSKVLRAAAHAEMLQRGGVAKGALHAGEKFRVSASAVAHAKRQVKHRGKNELERLAKT